MDVILRAKVELLVPVEGGGRNERAGKPMLALERRAFLPFAPYPGLIIRIAGGSWSVEEVSVADFADGPIIVMLASDYIREFDNVLTPGKYDLEGWTVGRLP